MADPTTPTPTFALTADQLLAYKEVQERVQNLESLIEKILPLQAKAALEDITFSVSDIKTKLIRDLGEITKGFSDVESGISRVAGKLTEDLKKSLITVSNSTLELTDIVSNLGVPPDKIEEVTKSFNDLSSGIDKALQSIKDNLNNTTPSETEFSTNKAKYLKNLQSLFDEMNTLSADNYAAFKENVGADAAEAFEQMLGLTSEQMAALTKEQRKALIDSISVDPALVVTLDTFKKSIQSISEGQGIKAKLEKLALQKEENELLKEKYEIEYPILKLQEMQLKNQEQLAGSMKGFADRLLSTNSSTTAFGSALALVMANTNGAVGGIKDLMGTLGTGFVNSILEPQMAVNRFSNFLEDKLIKSSFKFNSALAGINKETGGMGKEFEKIAVSNAVGGLFSASNLGAMAAYGVSLEKFSKTYGALSSQVSGFNNMLDRERDLLTRNAASFETLGLSASTYSKLVSGLMGSIGATADGVKRSITDLAMDAIELGRSVGQYADSFASMLPRLTAYAADAKQQMKELSIYANATKGALKETELLDFSSKFDTFEGAAEAASKLNAVLGGMSVNALELMRADPAERIMAIKRAAEAASLDFNSLNRGYKQLLAEYFGGDVQKAAAFFNANTAEAQLMLNQSLDKEKELEERKRKSVDAQQKLNIAIENMSIALTPVVKIVDGIANLFIFINDKFGAFGSFVAGFGLVLAPMVYVFYKIKTSIVDTMATAMQALQVLSAQLDQISTKLGTVNNASNVARFTTPLAGGAGGGAAMSFGKSLGLMTAITAVGLGLSALGSATTTPSDAPVVKDGIIGMTPNSQPILAGGSDAIIRMTASGKQQIIGGVAGDDALKVVAGKSGGPMDKSFNLFGASPLPAATAAAASPSVVVLSQTSAVGQPVTTAVENLTRVTTDRNNKLDSQVSEKERTERERTEKAFASAIEKTVTNSSNMFSSIITNNNNREVESRPLNITLNWDSEKLAGVIKKQVFASSQEIA